MKVASGTCSRYPCVHYTTWRWWARFRTVRQPSTLPKSSCQMWCSWTLAWAGTPMAIPLKGVSNRNTMKWELSCARAHEEKEYLNLVAKDGYSGWSYLLKQSVSDTSAPVRPCAHGSIYHQWDASPLRFSHRPADSAPTRGPGDDGPRLQQLFHLRKLVLGTKSVENCINAIY